MQHTIVNKLHTVVFSDVLAFQYCLIFLYIQIMTGTLCGLVFYNDQKYTVFRCEAQDKGHVITNFLLAYLSLPVLSWSLLQCILNCANVMNFLPHIQHLIIG